MTPSNERGPGPAGFVLLHGVGAGPECWDDARHRLAQQRPNSIVTAPRIANVDGSMTFSLAGGVDIARSALADVPGPRVLVGHSLGALVALDTAIGHPAELDALVLVSGFAKAPRALLTVQAFVFDLLPSRILARQGVTKSALVEPMRALRTYDRRDAARFLRVPTLVVCGGRDRANLGSARQLHTLIPGSGLAVIPGVGHNVPEQSAERLVTSILRHSVELP